MPHPQPQQEAFWEPVETKRAVGMEKMIENKVVLVTGAGRGIGREVAKLMAAYGAKVVVNDPGVHLYGSYNVSRAAAEHFRKQESGAFVHMTSTSGLVGNPGQANYSAAKMGIVGLSKSIALDMARFNVRSNCISPFAWSRMVGSIPNTPEQEERLKALKMLTPDKTANVAVFLASDAAREVSGQILAVRGNEVFLMSQPRPTRSVHRSEGWTPETLRDHLLPALRPSF